jgi:cell wall-associated NlpC family hydrolase
MKSFRRQLSAALCLAAFSASVAFAQQIQFANPLTERAYAKADEVFKDATSTHYEHLKELARDQVRFDNGSCSARTDCSGFVSYVLHSISPRHYEEIRLVQPERKYPQASAYEKFFASLSADQPQSGWLRVASIRDLRPGDIIAWAKPPAPDGSRKGNTGHVMFVAQRPTGVETEDVEGKRIRFVPVRVIDSSSVRHFPPEELPPNSGQSVRDGVGKGVVRIVVDDNDRPIGYWEGTYWGEGQKPLRHPSFTDSIAFARLIPFND